MTTTKPDLSLFDGDNTNLDNLLDRAAGDLHRHVSDERAHDDYETDLTNYLLGYHLGAANDGDEWLAAADAAMVQLVKDRMQEFIAVDCLLDETRQSSYDAAQAMATTLVAEIRAQNNQDAALHHLVTREIVERYNVSLGPACPGCGKRRRIERDPAFGTVEICLTSTCSYDK